MTFMDWDSIFELGIKEFDEHHKHLVHLLNMTYDGLTCGASHDELGAVLDELIDYATYHFAAEEYWMQIHKYHNLSQHHEEHERFCIRVVEIQKDFHQGKANLSPEVTQFLNSWLTYHILKTDAEYGLFAQGLSHAEHER
jgi:hemerythrin